MKNAVLCVIISLGIVMLAVGWHAAHGAELRIPRKPVVNAKVTMKREHAQPVYVPPTPVPAIDRPAGVP